MTPSIPIKGLCINTLLSLSLSLSVMVVVVFYDMMMMVVMGQFIDKNGHSFVGLLRVRYVAVLGGDYSTLAFSILPLPHSDYRFPTSPSSPTNLVSQLTTVHVPPPTISSSSTTTTASTTTTPPTTTPVSPLASEGGPLRPVMRRFEEERLFTTTTTATSGSNTAVSKAVEEMEWMERVAAYSSWRGPPPYPLPPHPHTTTTTALAAFHGDAIRNGAVLGQRLSGGSSSNDGGGGGSSSNPSPYICPRAFSGPPTVSFPFPPKNEVLEPLPKRHCPASPRSMSAALNLVYMMNI